MNFDDDEADLMDNGLSEFTKYEDYLDAQMSDDALFYLEDKELARQLIEQGVHGQGEILNREDFEKKQEAYFLARK